MDNQLMYQNVNTQLIELPVIGVAGGNQYGRVQFPNIPYLNGTFCRSLEVFTIDDVSLSPSNVPIIDDAVLRKSYLTLFIKDAANGEGNGRGGEWMQRIPLVCLHSLSNGVSPFEFDKFIMSGQIISWDKSYIDLATPIGNTTNVSYLLQVGFAFNPNYKAN